MATAKPELESRCATGRDSDRAEVARMRDLWQILGRLDQVEVLVDERPLPYARELWLPLAWFLIR